MIEDDIILLKEYRHTIDSWEWEIPAGSVEEGDDPERLLLEKFVKKQALI